MNQYKIQTSKTGRIKSVEETRIMNEGTTAPIHVFTTYWKQDDLYWSRCVAVGHHYDGGIRTWDPKDLPEIVKEILDAFSIDDLVLNLLKQKGIDAAIEIEIKKRRLGGLDE